MRTGGAHLDPSKLADLTPDDMVQIDGCDIYLKPDADTFTGATRRSKCIINPNATDAEQIYSWTRMRITLERFQYLDGWFDVNDNLTGDRGTPRYDFTKAED